MSWCLLLLTSALRSFVCLSVTFHILCRHVKHLKQVQPFVLFKFSCNEFSLCFICNMRFCVALQSMIDFFLNWRKPMLQNAIVPLQLCGASQTPWGTFSRPMIRCSV